MAIVFLHPNYYCVSSTCNIFRWVVVVVGHESKCVFRYQVEVKSSNLEFWVERSFCVVSRSYLIDHYAFVKTTATAMSDIPH